MVYIYSCGKICYPEIVPALDSWMHTSEDRIFGKMPKTIIYYVILLNLLYLIHCVELTLGHVIYTSIILTLTRILFPHQLEWYLYLSFLLYSASGTVYFNPIFLVYNSIGIYMVLTILFETIPFLGSLLSQ